MDFVEIEILLNRARALATAAMAPKKICTMTPTSISFVDGCAIQKGCLLTPDMLVSCNVHHLASSKKKRSRECVAPSIRQSYTVRSLLGIHFYKYINFQNDIFQIILTLFYLILHIMNIGIHDVLKIIFILCLAVFIQSDVLSLLHCFEDFSNLGGRLSSCT